MVDVAKEVNETVRVSGAIAKASTFGSIKAVSYLAIPLLELVIMAGVVYGIVSIPARFFNIGGDE